MNQRDKEYLNRIIMERMETIYARAKPQRLDETEQKDEQLDEAFQAALALLPPDNASSLREYCDAIFMSAAREHEFFYRAGVKDGILLLTLLQDIIHEEAYDSTSECGK